MELGEPFGMHLVDDGVVERNPILHESPLAAPDKLRIDDNTFGHERCAVSFIKGVSSPVFV